MRAAAEVRVDSLEAGREVQLVALEVAELLALGEYERSRGLYPGRHFRRARGQGCYHLRVRPDGSAAWLHIDRWDPRRYPVRHFLEVRELALGLPVATTVVGVVGGLLARRVL